MQQKDFDNYFSDLASKYLSGNASPAEVQELEQWVSASPENKTQFIAFKKTWMLAGIKQDQQVVDVDAMWKKTATQIQQPTKVVEMKGSSSRRRWLSIAASIALVAVASYFIFQNFSGDKPLLVETTNESKTFDLADGTQITLNQASSINYVVNNQQQREVNLKGDAFFKVARDEEHPFVINTQNIQVEVLGTSFYVDARESESEMQVIVQSGKVAVRVADAEVVLNKNEKAIFKKSTNQLIKQANDDANYLAVQSKILVFEDTNLEEVIFAINRQYNSQIILKSEALKTCKLNATFNNKSIATILKILESSFNIQVKQNGQEINLTGTCSKNK